MGSLGFSYIGLIFLSCLFIPNILYVFFPPKDKIAIQENRILLAFERTGQILCTILVLIFDNFNIHQIDGWIIWLVLVALLMIAYLLCWARYFLGPHKSGDFFRSFLGIPFPLAILPVLAVAFLSVFGKVIWLGIASIILGIGHIGITAQNHDAIKGRRI